MTLYPNTIKSKLPGVGTTIFSVMTALANEHKAINLSQGFPDFESPADLIELVHGYMKQGMNQYAPMQGLLSLREQVSEKTKNLYGVEYDPESEINITSGGTQALYTAITAMIRDGDEVIVLEPAYDCYIPAIQLAGGVPVCIPLSGPEFKIDWNTVRKAMTFRTRMILINTPHNPAGTIFTANDFLELERITKGTEVIVLSDEVYEHIIFDGKKHESAISYPGLRERSFVVFSFGKTYHTTGWKMGYCFAPVNLMAEFRKVHQFVVFTSNTPIQYALADYLKNKSYLELPDFFQKKRDYFLELISASRFTFTPSQGTYFQLLDYSAITKEKDTNFAKRLTKEYGVASIPLSVFYQKAPDTKLLRFCFAKKDETLEKAADLICKV
ncbi:MAG: aminotransferase class I/II-fold pyridoxal phosphate-dependent enzyme [Bacteroidetes bacterium]|nr:MAG: aminotransferase class I/II-fold pyridoxal phosphate-dependent enzyme [Bacteroidota bacterium]